MPRVRVVDGVEVPAFLYGTAWKEERTEALVVEALAAGFRGIDTANQRKHYVEAAVGQAIAKAGVPRSKLFLQTKFTHVDGQDQRLPFDPAAPPREQVRQSFASSCEHLGTDHLDSYVLHGPSLRDRFSDEDWEIWRAMAELQREGRVRLLGVSNVSLRHLEALWAPGAGDAKPAFVQNRCYARTGWDAPVRQFYDAHGVVYQGFSLLTANQRELAHPSVRRIASRTGRTVAEVVFAFALAVGMMPLTGTSDPRHMREDLSALDLALTVDEVETLARIATA